MNSLHTRKSLLSSAATDLVDPDDRRAEFTDREGKPPPVGGYKA